MQCREKLSWLLITLSVSFSVSVQYFSLNKWERKGARQQKNRRGGGAMDFQDVDFGQVFWARLWSAWVCGPRATVVTVSRIIQSSLVPLIIRLFKKINSPYLRVPSLQMSSPIQTAGETQTQLHRTEQTNLPISPIIQLQLGLQSPGIFPHPIKTAQDTLGFRRCLSYH